MDDDDEEEEEECASLAVAHTNQLAAKDSRSDEASREIKNLELQKSKSESEQVVLQSSLPVSPPTKWESESESFDNFP